MIGYKIFGPDYTCQGYKYALDRVNVYDGDIELGEKGFHFCMDPTVCWDYYDDEPSNTYAIVKSEDANITDCYTVVCNQLRIVKTLTRDEFCRITCTIDNSFLKCSYKEGVRCGEFKRFYENGKLHAECVYVDGRICGDYKEYYRDGTLKINTTYKDGVQCGDFKRWWKNGLLREHNKTPVDDIEERMQFYDNGMVEMRSLYKSGKLHGNSTKWWINGSVKSHYKFNEGVPVEDFKRWYINGVPKESGYYKDGVEHIVMRWNKDGTVLE